MFRYISSKNKQIYKLVKAPITLRGGKETFVYYFTSEEIPLKKGTYLADNLPDGFEIYETTNGKPLVRKVAH